MPGTAGPNLGLTYGWGSGETGWGDAVNGDFRKLDSLVMPAVKDKDLATPPGSPSDGDRYIVAGSPTGSWTAHAKDIALWVTASAAWTFYTPREGYVVWVNDENDFYVYDGSVWAVYAAGTAHALLGTQHSDSTAGTVVRGDIITGQGASPTWKRLAKGTAGTILTMGADEPEWDAPGAGSNHDLLDGSVAQDTVAGTVVRGDLVVGNSTPKWVRFARGSTDQFLKTNSSGDLEWSTPGGGSLAPAGRHFILARAFDGDAVSGTRGSGSSMAETLSLFGTSDRDETAYWFVPDDFTSLSTLKFYYVNTATASTNNFVIKVGMKVLAAGDDLTQAPTFATKNTITPPATLDIIDIVTLNNPAVSLAPGDVVRIVIERPASSDGDDANTDAMAMIGLLITYA